MASLRNALPRRAHKERSQPSARKKYGLLEKHKDYVVRAKAFHKKEETIKKLREKAAFKNPDEFYFQMINSRTVNGVHKPGIEANKYSQEELMLMKTQDIGYVMQKILSEKKKIEKLTVVLHSTDNQPSNKHVYYAEDRDDAKEISKQISRGGEIPAIDLPHQIKKKTIASYRELEDRKSRLKDLEKLYMDMALQKELQLCGVSLEDEETIPAIDVVDATIFGHCNIRMTESGRMIRAPPTQTSFASKPAASSSSTCSCSKDIQDNLFPVIQKMSDDMARILSLLETHAFPASKGLVSGAGTSSAAARARPRTNVIIEQDDDTDELFGE